MTTLAQISSPPQQSAEVVANENFAACSHVAGFGKNPLTTSGLTWGYLDGQVMIDGLSTAIAAGTVVLSANSTVYVSLSRAGVVSASATRSAGNAPLYRITTGASAVTAVVDERSVGAFARLTHGRAAIAVPNANVTLTQEQALCNSIALSGALTALRDCVLPSVPRMWSIFAGTTGGFGVRVIGPSGTGVTIADGKRAFVEHDGTNVVRLTPDT